MPRRYKILPIDCEKFKNILSQIKPLTHMSLEMGYSKAYLNNSKQRGYILPATADAIEHRYGIKYDSYKLPEPELPEPENHETPQQAPIEIDYDKLYDTIFRAMKAALEA